MNKGIRGTVFSRGLVLQQKDIIKHKFTQFSWFVNSKRSQTDSGLM